MSKLSLVLAGVLWVACSSTTPPGNRGPSPADAAGAVDLPPFPDFGMPGGADMASPDAKTPDAGGDAKGKGTTDATPDASADRPGDTTDTTIFGNVDAGADGDAGLDATADLPLDVAADLLAADVTPDAFVAASVQFDGYLDAWRTLYTARVVACFHASAEAIAAGPPPEGPSLGPSLDLGLLAFDAAAGEACLAAVRAATCDDLLALALFGESEAWRSFFPACAGVVKAMVASGSSCLDDANCSTAGEICFGDMACGPTCVPAEPPAPLGAPCDGLRCPAGAVCGANPLPDGPEQCHLRGTDGALCDTGAACATGFHCSFPALGDQLGACRPAKVGGACDGSWSCPFMLACVGASAGQKGTCQAGRALGEACAVQGDDGNGLIFHDCAFSLVCVDLDGKGPHCLAGSKLEGPCGLHKVVADSFATVPCLEGMCQLAEGDAGSASGVCKPLRKQGATCDGDEQCERPLVCGLVPPATIATCQAQSAPLPIGSACTLFVDECVKGAFCRPDATDAGESQVGKCQPLRKVGEACVENVDQCETLTGCVGGMCRRC